VAPVDHTKESGATPPLAFTVAVPSGIQEAGVEEIEAVNTVGSFTEKFIEFEQEFISNTVTE
jgi:hypothetical protein